MASSTSYVHLFKGDRERIRVHHWQTDEGSKLNVRLGDHVEIGGDTEAVINLLNDGLTFAQETYERGSHRV